MFGKFLVIFGSLAIARAAVLRAAPAVLAKIEDFDPAPQYSFAYDVQDSITGDSKAQYETRNGDLVQGSYSLIEADGTRRIVDYTADSVNGFNAIVSREPAIAVAPVAAKTAVVPAVATAPARAAIVTAPGIIPARAAYVAQYPVAAKTAIIPAATAPFVAAPGVISARAAYVPQYSAPAVARLAAPLTYAAAGYAI